LPTRVLVILLFGLLVLVAALTFEAVTPETRLAKSSTPAISGEQEHGLIRRAIDPEIHVPHLSPVPVVRVEVEMRAYGPTKNAAFRPAAEHAFDFESQFPRRVTI